MTRGVNLEEYCMNRVHLFHDDYLIIEGYASRSKRASINIVIPAVSNAAEFVYQLWPLKEDLCGWPHLQADRDDKSVGGL